ncbi:MAG: MAPEG family protein [Steroidobacteraceae bacterium]
MFTSLPTLLAACIVLGLAHVFLASTLVSMSRGARWNAGNRDGEAPPVSLHAARAQRASMNFLETFPFFAAALVCAIAVSRVGYLVEVGAQIYFWARLVYLPVYVIGIPGLRSLVWLVSLVGLLMVVAALL